VAPLITVEELRAYARVPIADDRAALAVAGASGAVRAHCRWSISQEVGVTLRAAGTGVRVVGLPTMHLSTVDAVRVDGVVLDPGEYRWATRGQLYHVNGWARWSKVEVDCTHGYAEIPDVVRIVACGLATRYVSNPESLRIASVGTVQRTYTPLSELDLRLLDEFRLP
jgi:hypothetical protein